MSGEGAQLTLLDAGGRTPATEKVGLRASLPSEDAGGVGHGPAKRRTSAIASSGVPEA